MTAIRRMYALPELWTWDKGPLDMHTMSRATPTLSSIREGDFPVLIMTPEAAEELFQAARKIYSSGEGTNSYEYESARDYLATLEKEIGNG